METMDERLQKRITMVVDPEVKEWVKMEAAKRKWSMSLFCREMIMEAMAREVKTGE